MPRLIRTADVDPITFNDLASLGLAKGPAVSVFMPTDRSGPETLDGPLRLRSLLDRAEKELTAQKVSDVEAAEIVAPLRELGENERFWQRTADGVAMYATRGASRALRVAVDLPEIVHVGDVFAIRPLVPLAVGDGGFLILALSQNSVRLFEGSREMIRELDIGDTPSSLEDTEGKTERQPQLQHQSHPGGGASYHGHGVGAEIDEKMLEKFIRQVAHGLDDLLPGNERRPLVLASVSEHHPMLKKNLKYAHLVDEVAAGNPDAVDAHELHEKAWRIVEPLLGAAASLEAERFGESLGTGLGIRGGAEILNAAKEGRVDTLLLSRDACRPEHRPDDIDEAIGQTLNTSGRLVVLDELPRAAAAGAILRY